MSNKELSFVYTVESEYSNDESSWLILPNLNLKEPSLVTNGILSVRVFEIRQCTRSSENSLAWINNLSHPNVLPREGY
jgi:hypothetical protein